MINTQELGRQEQSCPQVCIRKGRMKTRAGINGRLKKNPGDNFKKGSFPNVTNKPLSRVIESIHSIDSNK